MESVRVYHLIVSVCILSQLGNTMPTTVSSPASSTELTRSQCRMLGQRVHHPSNSALRAWLEEAKEQGMEADLLWLGDLHLKVSNDTNDCPANELARQKHDKVRGRATCAYKEVHLEVDQSQVGAVRIFLSEIETAMSCSSVPGSTFPPKECRVTTVHKGVCSNVLHRKRILRETGGCRWSEEDSKYYWTYELKSVMVNKTVLCARPKP